MDVETITVSYEASAKWHYKAVRQIQKSMPDLRRIHIAIAVLFALVVLIDGTLVALTGRSEIGGPKGWVLLGSAIIGVFLLVRLIQR